ncbi:toxin-antitoxin system protein [Paludisphaera borealis]|uniref:toxin-antitoxin system protein n=1 Tax=Paludisphaera borealis TaxID=1387353 RepID=UPI001F17BE9D|nr:toxin-antitoxin system protein [Paludisphaera borealis]
MVVVVMETLTVRISRLSHSLLRELAGETDETMVEVLDKAVRAYRNATLLAGLDADYRALRDDPAAWAEELRERESWDGTVGDGLND